LDRGSLGTKQAQGRLAVRDGHDPTSKLDPETLKGYWPATVDDIDCFEPGVVIGLLHRRRLPFISGRCGTGTMAERSGKLPFDSLLQIGPGQRQ